MTGNVQSYTLGAGEVDRLLAGVIREMIRDDAQLRAVCLSALVDPTERDIATGMRLLKAELTHMLEGRVS